MSLDEQDDSQDIQVIGEDIQQVIEDENVCTKDPSQDDDAMSEDEDDQEDQDQILFQDDSIQGFFGHEQNPVYCIASHPSNPSLILTGGGNDMAYLWNCESGELIHTMPAHKDSVCAVGFNFDGSYCASGGMDGIIHFLSFKTFESLSLEGPSSVTCLHWHPKGNVLLAGSEDGTIWMWNIPSGSCMSVLTGHLQEITCCQFSPDGKRIVSISSDISLIVWDPKSSSVLFKITSEDARFHQASVHSLDLFKEMILTGAEDGSIRLLHLNTGKILSTFENHSDAVESVAFSKDVNYAVTGSVDGLICIWDLSNFELRQSIRHSSHEQEAITKLIWIPKTFYFISTSMDGTVVKWDARTGHMIQTWKGHQDGILDVVLNSDSSRVCTGSDDGMSLVFVNTL